ncbi:MAG: STAS domain-containing protein [Candidatus Endonucleobacter bathymodioli]|uniref:Anti-sigma factor antagonist n=1 Tax=Candidatus Endonucleibacter bathymodioli TaxID=539814 RepID=A0AA90NJP2_9GAMM|nr:STAS domain-containing protein [Candidatus Endonucleobacter bathymodioli]
MSFGSREDGRFTVAIVEDVRLDASLAEAFKSFLFDSIEKGAVAIIVDLTNVKFMDSSGLGALVAALKKMPGNGQLILAGAQPAVRDLFDLTSMDKLFSIASTVDDALVNY